MSLARIGIGTDKQLIDTGRSAPVLSAPVAATGRVGRVLSWPLKRMVLRLAGRTERHLNGGEPRHRDRVIAAATRHAESIGVRVVRMLRYRGDDKLILLCTRSDGSEAVLKYVSPHSRRVAASAHGAPLRVVADSGTELFPRCHALGDHWSLEQWIGGTKLMNFRSAAEWDAVDLAPFFQELRRFSRSVPMVPDMIGAAEVDLILDKYLHSLFIFSRLRPSLEQLRTAVRFHRSRHELSSLIQRFRDVAKEASIPAGLVIDDLCDNNVVLCDQTGGLVVIDVEHIKRGVLGFDCVWLLSTMAPRTCPADKLVGAYRLVTSDAYLSNQTEITLSRLLLHIVLTADSLRFRPAPPALAALRQAVAEDLRDVI